MGGRVLEGENKDRGCRKGEARTDRSSMKSWGHTRGYGSYWSSHRTSNSRWRVKKLKKRIGLHTKTHFLLFHRRVQFFSLFLCFNLNEAILSISCHLLKSSFSNLFKNTEEKSNFQLRVWFFKRGSFGFQRLLGTKSLQLRLIQCWRSKREREAQLFNRSIHNLEIR